MLSTILEAVDSHNLALLGLQEVRFMEEKEGSQLFCDQAADVVRCLNDGLKSRGPFVALYAKLVRPFLSERDPLFRIDGNAIIVDTSLFSVVSHNSCVLSDCRVVQRAFVRSVKHSKIELSFANTHLHHVIEDASIRLEQAKLCINFLQHGLMRSSVASESSKGSRQDIALGILVGDMNAPPHEPATQLFKTTYSSTFETVHGGEPASTFPTGLKAPFMDTDPPGTFDYIYHTRRGGCRPVAAALFGHTTAVGDSTMYPSDHLGIAASLELLVPSGCEGKHDVAIRSGESSLV